MQLLISEEQNQVEVKAKISALIKEALEKVLEGEEFSREFIDAAEISMVFIDENRTGMKISVNQSLCVVHKLKFQFCCFKSQGIIIIQLPFNEFRIGREDVISSETVCVRLGVNQIFGNAA